MKKSTTLLFTSVITLSILLLGCATPIPPSRYVDLNSLSGYDIQSVALGLVSGKPPETVKEKASIATFFTPDGENKVSMLARLGRSGDQISNEWRIFTIFK